LTVERTVGELRELLDDFVLLLDELPARLLPLLPLVLTLSEAPFPPLPPLFEELFALLERLLS